MSAPDRRVLLTSLMLLVSACDSNGGNDDPPEAAVPERGTLVQDPPPRVSSYSSGDIAAALGASPQGQLLLQFAGTPTCRVDVHHVEYHTVGALDEPTTATAALMIPAGLEDACRGERPVLLYAHGTTIDAAFNLANVEDPQSVESLLLALTFVARGYIVIAPNYAGHDASALPYHPYLNADQSAKDLIDALDASLDAVPTNEAPTTSAASELFITGYSQGGHAAMAAHRALQAAGRAVTASAPMSGPYALSAFGDAVFYGQVNGGAPLFTALLTNSYQRAYGNLYATPADMFEAPYAEQIETLFPTTLSRSEIFDQGLLPREELFSRTPPAPELAQYTPATQPEAFAPLFARGFGAEHLITNEYRLAYLQDAQANPDGAYPTTTTGAPPATPRHPLRQALKMNDLRNWIPTSPVLLCGGSGDPTVYFFNTQLMQGHWAGSSAVVTVVDVDASPSQSDPYAQLKERFDLAKQIIAAEALAQGATDGGQAAVLDAYHGTLVPPFCLTAVRDYFDTLADG